MADRVRAALLLAVAVLTTVLVAPATGAPERATAAPRIVVTPTAPLHGEQYVVRGTARRGPAPALLQAYRKGGWRTVARTTTTRAGAFSFTRRATEDVALRVRVPATARTAAWVSRTRVVDRQVDSLALRLQGDIGSTRATATVRPIRPGRPVALQAWRSGTWQTIGAARPQDAAGTAAWTLVGLPGRSSVYRVQVASWKGAPATSGAVRTFAPALLPRTLPRVDLVTDDAAPADGTPDPVVSKDTYLHGTLTVGGTSHPMQIKGRGNSTWEMPKKPYRIKLDTKASLLGLPAERDWVLLANYADRSLLRTWTAFALSRETDLAWTPRDTFVDVTLNGTELGSYVLTEQVEASSAKVQLADGGLLLEVDERYPTTGDPGFTSARGMPIAYKDPDDPTAEQQEAVRAAVDDLEARLAGPDFAHPTLGYRAVLDVDSFADWYLVNEFCKNVDADFFSSVFVRWDPAGTFAMGPVWDFDLSAGYGFAGLEYSSPEGWWLRGTGGAGGHSQHQTHWIARMLQDSAFAAQVATRWRELSPVFAAVVENLDVQAVALGNSALSDWALWRTGQEPVLGTVHADDFAGEVGFLRQWFQARHAWMDDQLGVS